MWSEKWQIAKRMPYLDCNRSTRRCHRIRVPNRPTERQSPQKKDRCQPTVGSGP